MASLPIFETERAMALLAKATCFEIDGLFVEKRSDDLWAVVDGRYVLNLSGKFEYEPQPSSRTDEFLARTRYPLNVAIQRAEAAATRIRNRGEAK